MCDLLDTVRPRPFARQRVGTRTRAVDDALQPEQVVHGRQFGIHGRRVAPQAIAADEKPHDSSDIAAVDRRILDRAQPRAKLQPPAPCELQILTLPRQPLRQCLGRQPPRRAIGRLFGNREFGDSSRRMSSSERHSACSP